MITGSDSAPLSAEKITLASTKKLRHLIYFVILLHLVSECLNDRIKGVNGSLETQTGLMRRL